MPRTACDKILSGWRSSICRERKCEGMFVLNSGGEGDLRQGNPLQATGMQCVVYIFFILHLVACKHDLLHVADNHDVAVHYGAVIRGLVLALKDVGEVRRQASDHFACGVDVPPTRRRDGGGRS